MAISLVPWLMLAALMAAATAESSSNASCPDNCGGMSIEYPFGIGAGCFRNGFEIVCDNGSRPVLAGATTPIPVSHLSITTAEARVMLPVAWECYNASDVVYAWSDGDVAFNLADVYRVSSTHNELVVVGCNTLGYIQSQRSEGNDYSYAYYTGCLSFCNDSRSAADGACDGVGCCHVDIPPGITDNKMNFRTYSHVARLGYSPCDYAFIVDRENYTFRTEDLRMDLNRTMPVWLDWAIRDNVTCDEAKKSQAYACVSSNSDCHDSLNGPGYVCNCSMGYEGNPYIVDGCTGFCPLLLGLLWGLLGDEPVAVKKPKNVNLAVQFTNEVIIQSRVMHKNIVKLIGCCLEVDIPILVYEFVPKGSLDDILHGNREPLDLDQRLDIAAQSARGLAYLHSDTITSILHGDIKPANILLSDDLVPKISDFGISRMITVDKKYTRNVIGDVSYVDPVYLQWRPPRLQELFRLAGDQRNS
ncbi:hypothetical protein HU200_003045 [Digitaria exilis]|uniref:non-specific serine/threonine protein kinase n=1 Tax=Digitaria exilis TaxID=1010633 RepID=A0A835FUK8_9POAL|nr:hypothetical protein HU200_003045 [Digitaria exilis]